jgi:polynucleotide 5'-triphosphatase
MIATRPDHLHGNVEVEAKVGLLKERISGQRLALPILVETSTSHVNACRSVMFLFFT